MLLQLATVYAIMNIARYAIKNKQKKIPPNCYQTSNYTAYNLDWKKKN